MDRLKFDFLVAKTTHCLKNETINNMKVVKEKHIYFIHLYFEWNSIYSIVKLDLYVNGEQFLLIIIIIIIILYYHF